MYDEEENVEDGDFKIGDEEELDNPEEFPICLAWTKKIRTKTTN